MTFIVTLSLSSQTIQSYLQGNLQNLLGADAVVSQKGALTVEQYDSLKRFSNNVINTQQIDTTITVDGKWQKTKLKAVGNNYPLQGQLLTSKSRLTADIVTRGGPQRGNIWLDSRLFSSLGVSIGDVVNIGEHVFTVSRLLNHEPDRLMEGHNVAMRAIINTADLKVFAFSPDLILNRYLVTASTSQVKQLIDWQKSKLPGAKTYHKQGAHPLASFWKRTENFLGLASIILFFMAAIAVEQIAKVHLKKEQYFSAVCMSVGASKFSGLKISLFKWAINLLLLLPVVFIVSTFFHWLVVDWLSGTFSTLVWRLNYLLTFKTLALCVCLFAVFHFPVWLTLSKTPVSRLFDATKQGFSLILTKLCALFVLVNIVINYSDNTLLTMMLVSAIAITIILMAAMSWAFLTLGEKTTQHVSGLIPFTFFMMRQRLLSKSTQILGIGLSTFLLLFTLMLLKDLGDTMSSYQRTHDGNLMISQASQPEMKAIKQWSDHNKITIRETKPYMYAKVVKINGQTLSDFTQKPSDSSATLSHSIRLHWSQAIPQNNNLVQGKWWLNKTPQWQQVSIEEEVMTDLGLSLGDKLTFIINQKSYIFTVTASHVYKSGAGSITFWMQIPPTAIQHINAPHYHMAGLEIQDAQWPLLSQLWEKHPSIRMTPLKELVKHFDNTLAMITKVISGFALTIILLAIIVILSSINALESNEKKKNSVIMSFGFLKSTCWQLNIIEWLITAFIIGIGAIVGTYITGILIYQSQFSMMYQPNLLTLFLTLVTILCTVTLLGVYASRHNLKSSVKQLMADT